MESQIKVPGKTCSMVPGTYSQGISMNCYFHFHGLSNVFSSKFPIGQE